MLSMGSEGAILIDEYENVHKMKIACEDKTINTVGAGDSMVAGFIAGYQKFGNLKKALQMGVASGTATANSAFLAKKEDVLRYFEILEC